MAGARVIEPDLEFIRATKKAGGETLKKCYQCATCSTVCNLSPDDRPFPRKEMLMAGWGQSQELMKDPDVWLCYQCNDCTLYCPRGARPGDVLAAIRAFTYKHFAVPSFMGGALASARALPLLLLVPIAVLVGCILTTAPRTPEGGFLFMEGKVADFNVFLPHSSVDVLFVFGNLLIFILAATGFIRFWKMLKSNGAPQRLTFLQGAVSTLGEILSHSKFRKCDVNRPRAIGHMLLLYGFIGAMITTGSVFVFIFIPHYLHLLGAEGLNSFFELPVELPHPVKILGALSGVALAVGGGLLIYRRMGKRDDVGANGYGDNLFLWVVFLTGLTGMAAWLTRHTALPMLAYASYFVHLVLVFFLLWYMPYSKFAHMIYRSLAIVHARCTGRDGAA